MNIRGQSLASPAVSYKGGWFFKIVLALVATGTIIMFVMMVGRGLDRPIAQISQETGKCVKVLSPRDDLTCDNFEKASNLYGREWVR